MSFSPDGVQHAGWNGILHGGVIGQMPQPAERNRKMLQSSRRSASTCRVTIREYKSGDEIAFRKLNEEWITHYFRLEAKDEEALSDPQSSILASGGRIFFADVGDGCVGCCGLLRTGASEFEVAKMAVTSSCQGSGIGRKLLHAAIEAARSAGARRLYLETNHILTPAIRLYESVGFKPLPPDRIVPSPYARTDVYMEMTLV
ncbi:MAG: GNAT family N-acetyltransferase [Bryobacteraceae bacterium]